MRENLPPKRVSSAPIARAFLRARFLLLSRFLFSPVFPSRSRNEDNIASIVSSIDFLDDERSSIRGEEDGGGEKEAIFRKVRIEREACLRGLAASLHIATYPTNVETKPRHSPNCT